MSLAFEKWLDTFLEEKNIDLSETFEIKTKDYLHIFDYGSVIDAIKATSPKEQKNIKKMLVRLDFFNKDIKDYLRHLAKALV